MSGDVGLLQGLTEGERRAVRVVTDSLREETAKSMIDYVPNLICCLLDFTVAQHL